MGASSQTKSTQLTYFCFGRQFLPLTGTCHPTGPTGHRSPARSSGSSESPTRTISRSYGVSLSTKWVTPRSA